MQLAPILLIAVVLAADSGFRLIEPPAWVTPWRSLFLTCGPVLTIIAVAVLGVHFCRRRLVRAGGPRWILRADRMIRAGRVLILLHHCVSLLVFDWLVTVRQVVGDQILIDEILAIAPAVMGLMGLWWAHYPIERRVREALLVRQLDLGRVIQPIGSRRAFVIQQVRLHLLLLLVPVLLIVGVSEIIDRVMPEPIDPTQTLATRDLVSMAGGLVVFMIAPLLARWLLAVRPLTSGIVRDELMAVCTANRVRIREVLRWDTGGTMINAAVMGLIGHLRYVLMTDALLESMRRAEILAVMAHEIGHVRRHHMPWLVVSLAATLAVTWYIQVPLVLWEDHLPPWILANPNIVEGTVIALQLLAILIVFGWVSRRFERQADTFAVQHLSAVPLEEGDAPSRHVTDDAVDAMTGALGAIASLNSVARTRRSWRHGSIAWRQEYLDAIRGLPVGAIVIDRVVRRIKLVSFLVLITAVGGIIWLESGNFGSPAIDPDHSMLHWSELVEEARP